MSENNLQTQGCKLASLEMDPNNPWKDDALMRKNLAASLLNFVKNETNPITIAIDGKWGTGKTFFLNRWKASLEKEGATAVFINVWEDDFIDNPMLTILGQLNKKINDCDKAAKFPEVVSKVKNKLPKLFVDGGLRLLSAVTYGALPDNKEAYCSVERKAVDTYADRLAQKNTFKEELAQFAQAVYEETNGPLIFIIDELDRCRPTYSIEFLERVKHFFDVPHVVFVMGVDLNNLKKSICSVYGDIEIDDYLRRFFDFEFRLPELPADIYFDVLAKRYQLAPDFLWKNSYRTEYYGYQIARYCLDKKSVSLRQIEYFMRMLVLALRKGNMSDDECNAFFIFMALKIIQQDLYDAVKTNKKTLLDVIDYFADFLKNYEAQKYDRYYIYKDSVALLLYKIFINSSTDMQHEVEKWKAFLNSECNGSFIFAKSTLSLSREKQAELAQDVIKKANGFKFCISKDELFDQLELSHTFFSGKHVFCS